MNAAKESNEKSDAATIIEDLTPDETKSDDVKGGTTGTFSFGVEREMKSS